MTNEQISEIGIETYTVQTLMYVARELRDAKRYNAKMRTIISMERDLRECAAKAREAILAHALRYAGAQ